MDTNLSSYVPNANVDHTVSDQGTGIRPLGHHTKGINTMLCRILMDLDGMYFSIIDIICFLNSFQF